MAIKVLNAGALRDINSVRVMQAGVLRTVKTVQVQDGGTLRLVWATSLSVTITPSSLTKSGTSSTLQTSSANAVPNGGIAPYTYSWSLVSSQGTASVASTPNSASTIFSKTNIPQDTSQTDVWRVTVTDSIGQTATADISVLFYYFNFGGF